MKEIKEDAAIRFWSKVDKRGPSECWEWMGGLMPRGYGWYLDGGVKHLAHRYSWILHNGPIKNGLNICHSCDNPPCVNPAHLWLGTQQENMSDMASKGRSGGTYGEDHPRAKLTWADVREIRRLYASGGYTQTYFAKIYGVSDHQIGLIVNFRRWRTMPKSEQAPIREEE